MLFDKILKDEEIINRYKEIDEYETNNNGGAHHNLKHVLSTAYLIEDILTKLGYKSDFIEEAKVAALLHDTGANLGKKDHAERSYQFACDYFKRKKIKLKYYDIVLEAIRIHNNGFYTKNTMALALILCDKLDIKKDRLMDNAKNMEGLRQFFNVEDVIIELNNNTLSIDFIANESLDFEELENYYFTPKIFKAIRAFALNINYFSVVKINGKIWHKYLELDEASEYELSGVNKNTHNLLFKDNDLIDPLEFGLSESAEVIRAINLYTKIVERNIFTKFLINFFSNKNKINIKNIRYNSDADMYEYICDDGSIITFDLISKNMVSADTIKQELISSKRETKCHSRSIDMAASTNESKILTGTIKMLNQKALHSVVLIKNPKTDKEKIIDWTRNIVMDKDEYICLFEFEIINEVDSSYILEDLKRINNSLFNKLDVKEYLTFRDEFIRDLEKNAFLYDQEDNKKK